jgi:hypothetical protein
MFFPLLKTAEEKQRSDAVCENRNARVTRGNCTKVLSVGFTAIYNLSTRYPDRRFHQPVSSRPELKPIVPIKFLNWTCRRQGT